MSIEDVIRNLPGDPDCPECGGKGWVVEFAGIPEAEQVGRCGLCMPPSFVLTPEGVRLGDPEIDCKDIGGRRVRKTAGDVPPECES